MKMKDKIEKQEAAASNRLLSFVPIPPEWKISWSELESTELQDLIKSLEKTPQNPKWHGEGDVWTHTKMACEVLVGLEGFRCLEERKRSELFVAVLLHDMGKVVCTKWMDGAWASPNHSSVGAQMAREFLWQNFGFCGTKELMEFRETVCTLIRYHSMSLHLLEKRSPEQLLVKVAANQQLLPDFSLELLFLLVEADFRGRIASDSKEILETLEMCRLLAEESDCMKRPLFFPSSFAQHAYLQGRNVVAGQELYDDTWGEVILMCGLPGTGKDTWIQTHYKEYPMVSLDALRLELGISPSEPQGAVMEAGRNLAKKYLREKLPFVWNATSLMPSLREKQLRLFENYHASVRIVYLETDWETQMLRNRSRKAVVSESVINNMRKKFVLPERFEAQEVEWKMV